MIFSPGFSTSESVNQWSGRGVGLDAVSQVVSALSGTVKVHTSPGIGTRISITLPLTLALTDALIVSAGGERYALAMSAIGECLQAQSSAIERLPNGQSLYRLRTQLLPFARLDALMGLPFAGAEGDKFVAIVLNTGDEACMLRVDEILGQKQIVIKSIAQNLGTARYCHSATILGDGQVIFVLDPIAVMQDVGSSLTEPA